MSTTPPVGGGQGRSPQDNYRTAVSLCYLILAGLIGALVWAVLTWLA